MHHRGHGPPSTAPRTSRPAAASCRPAPGRSPARACSSGHPFLVRLDLRLVLGDLLPERRDVLIDLLESPLAVRDAVLDEALLHLRLDDGGLSRLAGGRRAGSAPARCACISSVSFGTSEPFSSVSSLPTSSGQCDDVGVRLRDHVLRPGSSGPAGRAARPAAS